MSDLILNVRFGSWHLKWREHDWLPHWSVNSYWRTHKPKPWFFVYQFGNATFEHK